MRTMMMVAATTVVAGLWLAMLGTYWGRPQPIGNGIQLKQRRKRRDAGSRLVGVGAVLITLGVIGATVIGLIYGWQWAV